MDSKEYKDLSIKEFTRAAQVYETGHSGIYEMCKDDYPPILEELEKEPFADLLDAGCGTAPMVSLLSEKWPERRYTGLDLTPAMIEKAQAKGLPNATFVVGDCENLPFADASFDVVINSQSFHHYPNPQDFFDSVARVLRPGGKLVMRDNTGPAWMVNLLNHTEMPLANALGHGDVRVYTTDQVAQMVRKAGLAVETCEQRRNHRLHVVARKPK